MWLRGPAESRLDQVMNMLPRVTKTISINFQIFHNYIFIQTSTSSTTYQQTKERVYYIGISA